MAKNDIITIYAFGEEIGKVGYDLDERRSSFQYHPDFLNKGRYTNLFPNIIRRIPQAQVFRSFENESFRGLPPMIADSLPDMFGNTIFKAWMDSKRLDFGQISIIEQLAYVSNRGMGALEYYPGKNISKNADINLEEIVSVLEKVLASKGEASGEDLSSDSLLNIFKIGTSAGGARPKILISEDKKTHKIIPGDLGYSDKYNHYLVKLQLDEQLPYSREALEYSYYLTAVQAGIAMMDSHMIDGKHFATKRFDRQNGEKQHVLTASGMTGWAFSGDPRNSSYENLFMLAVSLKLPHREIEQLYRRMVFNVVYGNGDDHLKNHSFIFDREQDKWGLAPAYDITYSLNPMLKVTRSNRALSINNKRSGLVLADILSVSEKFTIKNARGIIEQIQGMADIWQQNMYGQSTPERIVSSIVADLQYFDV